MFFSIGASTLALMSFVTVDFYSSEKDFLQEKVYEDCVVKTTSNWGEKHCPMQPGGSGNTYRVTVKNVCDESIDVKLAVQEKDKRWKTFFRYGLAANDSMFGYACNAEKGKYKWWARKAGNNSLQFPSDNDINVMYSK